MFIDIELFGQVEMQDSCFTAAALPSQPISF